MTPADEARFIVLWNAGTETAEIGRQFGIPRGQVSPRTYTLVRQGKIQPSPKVGAYPRQKVRARQEDLPARTPAPPHGRTQRGSAMDRAALQGPD